MAEAILAQAACDSGAVIFRGHTFATERVPCDLCGGTEFYPFWARMRHNLHLPTVFCKACGLCMTNPRPTSEACTLFYEKLYNQFHKRESPLTLDGPYAERCRRLGAQRVACLARFLPRSNTAEVFEVGAGIGQFQAQARSQTSWRVSGIEPGDESSELCRRQGLDVTHGFFESAQLGDGVFSAVASFHVFEHLASPAAFVRKANALLKDGGLLYLEVPNLARPGGPSLSDFFQFPHLYSFSATTLRNYVSVVGGFEPLYVAESRANLTVVARKSRPARSGKPGLEELEQYNIEEFMQRLRIIERVYKLGRAIPPLPVLKKIRGTLFAV